MQSMDENEGRLFKLQIAHSYKDVATALDLDPEKLFHAVKRVDDGSYYKTFEIPKKNGGTRKISKPVRGIALAQDRFNPILNHVYNPKEYVRGFVRGTSFVENAHYHHAQRWILNIDLKDFFPSITFPRVRGLLMSDLFGFNDRVATILTRICTFEGCLPQGASTSPVLANLIAHSLDKKMVAIAREERLKYTRYSDDITFSSSKKAIPKSLIKSDVPHSGDATIILGDKLNDAVRKTGFIVNSEKTRIMLPNNRQEVTGLVVNERANVRRSDILNLRMKIYSVKKVGIAKAATTWVDGNGERLAQHIVGWLAHIRQVRGPSDPVLAKLCRQTIEAKITNTKWISELAEMTKDFDVFLSHASEDKEKVRKLRASLEERGINVFFDETSIKWGDSIVETVNHGLLKSTYFVPFLTTTFSKKGWTNKELNSAISMNISRKGRILPIKAADFDVDGRYPVLNDTLYKTWPSDEIQEEDFIAEITDAILALVESARDDPTK
ncbi:MAG: hypothetical protein Salg2KO_19340 [Salibacteraceae bacterium]